MIRHESGVTKCCKLRHAMPCHAVLYYAMLCYWYAWIYYAIRWYAILCYVMLYYTILYYTRLPYCAILCLQHHISPFHHLVIPSSYHLIISSGRDMMDRIGLVSIQSNVLTICSIILTSECCGHRFLDKLKGVKHLNTICCIILKSHCSVGTECLNDWKETVLWLPTVLLKSVKH